MRLVDLLAPAARHALEHLVAPLYGEAEPPNEPCPAKLEASRGGPVGMAAPAAPGGVALFATLVAGNQFQQGGQRLARHL